MAVAPALVMTVVARTLYAALSPRALRQSSLREAVGDALKITCILVRQDAFALRQRQLRVHLEKFRPCHARVVEAAEMAVISTIGPACRGVSWRPRRS